MNIANITRIMKGLSIDSNAAELAQLSKHIDTSVSQSAYSTL